MPVRAINNPTRAFSTGTYPSTAAPNVSDGPTVACSADSAVTTGIAFGQVVACSTTEGLDGPRVVVAATNQNVASLVGVAIEPANSGQSVEVAVQGATVYGAAKDTGSAISQFDFLTISATTTGALTTISGATAITTVAGLGKIVAVAVAAAITTAAVVDVMMVRL